MTISVVGRKCGMTRVFTEDGVSVPVTVVDVNNNRITQVKTEAVDGYRAVQLSYGEKRTNLVDKALAGHYAKASVPPGRGLHEVRLGHDEAPDVAVGSMVGADVFSPGDKVDVTGISKGKGFAGTVKRWNFSTQDATHGNSLSHRAPGSTGQNQTPGRVFKGKKMAGQMGNRTATEQNLEVVQVDAERNLLLIRGAVPGPTGGHVVVKSAVKAPYAEFRWSETDAEAQPQEDAAAAESDADTDTQGSAEIAEKAQAEASAGSEQPSGDGDRAGAQADKKEGE